MAKEKYFDWCYGANFYPSTAINQLEMWQADSFDEETIDRELGFAQKIGMTIMRVYLHDLLFEQDAPGFFKRMERYLAIADSHNIKTMFVFFDDCWKNEFSLGRQPDPLPFTHNSGWVQSPGDKAADDPAQRPRLKKYVQSVLEHFGADKRVVLWDLYNEPGNGCSGDNNIKKEMRTNKSLPLLKDVFAWAREVAPDQPLTAGAWLFDASFDDINKFVFDNSDLVTFHCYALPEHTEERILRIKAVAGNRQILCSEYLARTINCTISNCLPIYKKHNISAINWGLVSGKSQTIFPWNWNQEKGMPEKCFHDIFNPDGTLLHPEEQSTFDAVNPLLHF